MLEIRKQKIESGYIITINTNEGSFDIYRAGNQDYYWSYTPKNMLEEKEKSFYITTEDECLFSLFDKLYNDIKNYNININNYSLKNTQIEFDNNNPYKLFRNGKVEYYSDDFDYEDASSFIIKKLKDSYKITFKRSKSDSLFSTFSVRIRTSGSRYNYFYILFKNMYDKLIHYEPDYYQVTIEEYIKHLKLTKNK